jgi:hypothetical protein
MVLDAAGSGQSEGSGVQSSVAISVLRLVRVALSAAFHLSRSIVNSIREINTSKR